MKSTHKVVNAFVACLMSAALLTTVSAADTRNTDGILVHTVRSDYQSGQTRIKVLLPDVLEEGKRYRTLYVLPVETEDDPKYGDGLLEVKRHDLHNKHQLICVSPTFHSRSPMHLSWYADHPTDPGMRHESYFLKVVVPLVEGAYPVLAERDGRLLLGFSKSGWGAFSLLLRHPNLFGKAAAWDAPLDEARYANPRYSSMGLNFGNQENFEEYRISRLLERQAITLRKEKCRLILLGYGIFGPQQLATHDRMVALKIPHVYRDGPKRKHDWHSGWVAEAVDLLAGVAFGLAAARQAPSDTRAPVIAAVQEKTVVTTPESTDAILFNPGMGLAFCHFSCPKDWVYGKPTWMDEVSNHVYVRVLWKTVHPAPGEFSIDESQLGQYIAALKKKGKRFSFRIMPTCGSTPERDIAPSWIFDVKGVEFVDVPIGSYGELWFFGDEPEWRKHGFSADRAISATKELIDLYRRHFKRTRLALPIGGGSFEWPGWNSESSRQRRVYNQTIQYCRRVGVMVRCDGFRVQAEDLKERFPPLRGRVVRSTWH